MAKIWKDIRKIEGEDVAWRYAFCRYFLRPYERQYNLAGRRPLDKDNAQSYMLIIRMFARKNYFPDYWKQAPAEFNDAFAAYVDEQIDTLAADA